MAYGKIKADAVIWDNSGTDVEESMSNITGKLNKAGDAMTGNLTLNAQNELRLADSDSSHHVALKAPATIAADRTWTLPSTAPSAGQMITFAADGTISYADQPQGWFDGHAILRYNVGNNNTTTGGTATASTWNIRPINEIFENDGSVVSALSSNQFTLNNTKSQTCKYLIEWNGNVGYVNASATRLFNVTDSSVEGMGFTSYASASYWMDAKGCEGHVDITIPANTSRTYRIENIVQTTYATYGLGIGSGGTARNWGDGIHLIVNIWRYAN